MIKMFLIGIVLSLMIIPGVLGQGMQLCNPGEYRCGTGSGGNCVPAPSYCWLSLSSLWGIDPCAPVCSGSTSVIGGTAQWSIPCADDDGNGYFEWSRYNNRLCANGCDPPSGTCIHDISYECTIKCNLGDRKCLNDNESIVSCADMNADGCSEWSGTIVEFCNDGCLNGACLSNQPVLNKDHNCYDTQGPEYICGGIGNRYSIHKVDSDGDGCKDYGVEGDFCTYGCEDGMCNGKAKGCVSYCSNGTSQCGGDGDYIKNCVPTTGTSCYEWSDSWSYCEYGCYMSNNADARCKPVPINALLKNPVAPDNYTFGIYKMDDAGNTSVWADSSGNGNNLIGTYNSGSSYSSYSKFGSYSLYTTGVETFRCKTIGSVISKEFTIDFWFSADDSNDAFNMVTYGNAGRYFSVFHGSDDYPELKNVLTLSIGWTGHSEVLTLLRMPSFKSGEWHHLRIVFGVNEITAWIDGLRLKAYSSLYTDTLPIPSYADYTGTSMGVCINTGNGLDYVDDVHISRTARTWDLSCINECLNGSRNCVGGILGEYSVGCIYNPRNGCTKMDKANNNGIYCKYGCDQSTGICKASGDRVNRCSIGNVTCDGDYSVTCADSNADGFYDWSGARQLCPIGCIQQTGLCMPVQSFCSLGESRCLGAVSSPGENYMPRDGYVDLGSSGKSNRIFCGDMNNDGFYEWDINNLERCQWGCQEDYSGTTELHTASCNEAPNDLLRYQNAVSFASASFAVAFEGPVFRFAISIVAFMVAFGLGMYFTKSVTFGFGSGIGVLGVAIAAGWIPIVFVLAIFGIAAYMVFKAWTGGELTG